MINQKNKTVTFVAITITLILAVSSIMTTFVVAHDPPWSNITYALLSVAPDTAGVGQELILNFWLSTTPPTASGEYGDRWHNMNVEVTKPDGIKQTLGPFDSGPIGFGWAVYTPTEVGTYTFQFSFPGQTITGENIDPYDNTGEAFIGDYYEPSTSNIVSITVLQDPVPSYPDTSLPTGYWERPISGEHRNWGSISGNWLEWPPTRNDLPFAPYTEGPETGHILWAKPLVIGGLVGGEFGGTSYHGGNAYEGQWFPPVIINGILYYNRYPFDMYRTAGGGGAGNEYPRRGSLPGYYAVDLRTGEEIYYNNDTRIDFGQIYRYDSPNQHGAFAYLWSTAGSTWSAYEAFSGTWTYTIANVSGGTRATGPNGELFVYRLSTGGNWLTLWNSSAIPELMGAETGTEYWQWRPYGKTVDGNNGYSWNVTIPADLEGGINYVLDDRIIGSSGLGAVSERQYIGTEDYTVWALSLKPGQEGQLLWKKDYTGPGGLTLTMEAASLQDGVFTIWAANSRQHWGYSLDNGNPMWGPTESQGAWDMTVGTVGRIHYGKLLTRGYAGIIYCYDAKTGDLEWTWTADDPYYLEAKWGGNYLIDIAFVADEKIYAISGEHSPDDPKERGAMMACIDINTGEEIWRIPFYASHWSNNPAIADGIIVFESTYDNRIYAIGKGQTLTTVSAPQTAVPMGTPVVITGSVLDQSPGAKNTPAISDEDMSEWMKYMYMQYPIPGDALGVQVTLDTIDPNGNFIHIGEATSDLNGNFGFTWTPEIPGMHQIIATFEGSEAYYSSYATTYLSSFDAPTPVTPTPSPAPMTDTYLAGSTIAILAGIAIAVFLLLRKK